MKITSKYLLLFCLTSIIFFACKKNDTNNNETLNAQDRNFISQAALANTAEIQAGQLAATNADSSTVKSFAQTMVNDHTTAQGDLKALGNTLQVNVPDSIDSIHSSVMDSLKTLTGRAFDSVYIMNQIADHQKVISDFQEEVSSGNKSDVIGYANKYLPKLQMHLQMADSVATVMNFK